MVDRREQILRSILPPDQIWEEARHVDNVPFDNIFNAMDEHAKKMCLEFIDFVIKETTGHSIDDEGNVDFKYGDAWISKEELFENFL